VVHPFSGASLAMSANTFASSPGAGISVQAGIPDFRSPEGLFKTLKRDNPREVLASGKDLFDASVFNVSVCLGVNCRTPLKCIYASPISSPNTLLPFFAK
jgi:NAD-dependent histone deacetylase SIR2